MEQINIPALKGQPKVPDFFHESVDGMMVIIFQMQIVLENNMPELVLQSQKKANILSVALYMLKIWHHLQLGMCKEISLLLTWN